MNNKKQTVSIFLHHITKRRVIYNSLILLWSLNFARYTTVNHNSGFGAASPDCKFYVATLVSRFCAAWPWETVHETDKYCGPTPHSPSPFHNGLVIVFHTSFTWEAVGWHYPSFDRYARNYLEKCLCFSLNSPLQWTKDAGTAIMVIRTTPFWAHAFWKLQETWILTYSCQPNYNKQSVNLPRKWEDTKTHLDCTIGGDTFTLRATQLKRHEQKTQRSWHTEQAWQDSSHDSNAMIGGN